MASRLAVWCISISKYCRLCAGGARRASSVWCRSKATCPMGQKEDPPTNLSNHGRKGRASSPLVKYLEMGVFLSRSASDLPSFGASVSILSGGRPSFFGWQKSSFRKAKNFCAHENKFPHMRKYFFVYTEINFLICGNFLPSARKFFALRKETFFLPKGALFSFGEKDVFLPGEIDFPPKEKSPPFEGKKPGVRREKKRRAKGDFFSHVRK